MIIIHTYMSIVKRGRGRPRKFRNPQKCPTCGRLFVRRRRVYCSKTCSNVGRTGTYTQSAKTVAKRSATLKRLALDLEVRDQLGRQRRGNYQPLTPILNPFDDDEDTTWF